jgi:hypothetical protein
MKGNKKWCKVSICIISKTTNPEKISAILNVNPTESYEKGTRVSLKNPDSPKRLDHIWILESGLDESTKLQEQINFFIDLFKNKHTQFMKLSTSCKIELFCGISLADKQEMLTITSSTLRKISKIPVDIVFDIYS